MTDDDARRPCACGMYEVPTGVGSLAIQRLGAWDVHQDFGPCHTLDAGAAPGSTESADQSPDVAEVLAKVADALGTGVGLLADKTEQARRIAVALEQDLAEATRHVQALLAVLNRTGTTWAQDTAAVDDAHAWLAEQ